jgi:hypothetical protein
VDADTSGQHHRTNRQIQKVSNHNLWSPLTIPVIYFHISTIRG